jgi:UDP:flavonoid glycosyltransferase YjiC (YdhE family)
VATVAIAPLQEHGHILPTFEIASRLREAGHRVVYVGVEDCRAIVERRGFSFHAICRASLPAGSLAAMRARASSLTGSAMHAMESAWRAVAADELLTGEPPVAADLALVDRDWEEAALAFLPTRVVLHSITLWGAFPGLRLRDHLIDRDVPPLSTRARPPDSLARAVALWVAHGARELRHLAHTERVFAAIARMRWPALVARRRQLRRVFAGRHVRTLVLCPRELDIPRTRDAPRVDHVGPCIDTAREAEPVPELPAGPLVYASIGTQTHRAGAIARTFVDAAAGAPWTLVLAAPYDGRRPANVIALAHAPQLALLARADAAITHGGLGTIKECIWHGVPMLVLPGDHDQPGNAMRVELHGLGLAHDRAGLTPAAVRAAVDRLPAFRSRLRTWSELFRARQRDARHVEIIERELGTVYRSSTSST